MPSWREVDEEDFFIEAYAGMGRLVRSDAFSFHHFVVAQRWLVEILCPLGERYLFTYAEAGKDILQDAFGSGLPCQFAEGGDGLFHVVKECVGGDTHVCDGVFEA